MKQALTPAHFLANILDPMARGGKLSQEEVDSALEFRDKCYPKCMATIINYRAQSGPFKLYMFTSKLNVLGAVASSAGTERVFSTFGIVHSKLKSRLGAEKAGKLVFIYKVLNTEH
ncbi:uncharacterized protein [Watersipora subatra]|uniref:uncharacterized protein n=1 Tax=Watersipora subatra TaxID=2589382 RepID=UPI00355C1767